MKNSLGETIAGVPTRLEAPETEEGQEVAQREVDRTHKEARAFQNRVEGALGSEILASLGPVTYGVGSGINRMNFQIQDRPFELRQAIGSIVNLLAGERELFQFNLSNPQARDRFLEALGNALPVTT